MPKALHSTAPAPERTILVGVEWRGRRSQLGLDDSLDELARLAQSVGAQVVGRVTQRRDRPTSRYLGRGKLEDWGALLRKNLTTRNLQMVGLKNYQITLLAILA